MATRYLTIKSLQWQERGACRGVAPAISSLFTDHDTKQQEPDPECAALCRICDVQPECLEQGMLEKEGVWGGTTPYQRKQLGKRKYRVYCPGCGDAAVAGFNTDEVCLSCGLSWNTP